MQDKIQNVILCSAKIANTYQFKSLIPNHPNPLKLSKWMSEDIVEVTGKIEQIEREFGLGCVCQPGCSACCNQIIVVTYMECLAIKPLIDRLSYDSKAKLKEKVLEKCRLLEQNGFSNKEVTQTHSHKQERDIQNRYFSLDSPCIFLSEDKKCSIYSNRPTQCWAYRFYGSPTNCTSSASPVGSIIFSDWEKTIIERVYKAKKPKRTLYILPFGIKEVMEW